MGDRTALQAIVHDCPLAERVHVREILGDYFTEDGWTQLPAGEAAALGETYLDPEAYCGAADELAGKLAEVPGIVFTVWEDPKYEWMGDLRIFTPALGMFSAECDANGTAFISPAEILAIVDRCETKAEIVAELGKATGKPWEDAIAALGA